MKIKLIQKESVSLASECLIVGIFENGELTSSAQALDRASQGAIKKIIEQGDFTGEINQTLILYQIPQISATRVLLVGCGSPDKLTSTTFFKIAQTAFAATVKLPIKQAACFLSELSVPGMEEADRLRILAQIAETANNKFDLFKSKKTTKTHLLSELELFASGSEQSAIQVGQAIAHGINRARYLANMPCNICTPVYLAEQAKKLADEFSTITVKVLEKTELEQLKMGALLAVGQGSAHSSKLIEIHYQGSTPDRAPTVLIGKGITFDTGGISLKPPTGMEDMKFDMAGGASVIGTLAAIAELALPINVIGLVPTAENMPDGNAYRPGDILTSMSGQTIEVNNTDAEGRLVLCDALTYAARFQPTTVIDVATLTGAMVVALGYLMSGVFSNQDELARELIMAGQRSQDLAWHMPLIEEYGESLKSTSADMSNSSKLAGAITGACFLSRFAKDYRWAHIDCAGTAMPFEPNKAGGATGRPVSLLVEYLRYVSAS